MNARIPRYIIRRMGLGDLPEVMEIERLSFAQPWSHAAYLAELSRPRFCHYIVCSEGGRIVAQAGMQHAFEEAHITTIATHPDWRGKKIGEATLLGLLLKGLELGIERVTLEFRKSNTVAQNLYEKYGFVVVGVRRGYYQDNGEDALVAVLEGLCTLEGRERLLGLTRALEEQLDVGFRN